jgi:glycerol-3-phosphate dehydrogenase (NAD(P)+)
MAQQHIAVIGAGAWGTALALYLARLDREVRLWARRPELVEELARTRENRYYLPGCLLPETVVASSDLAEVLRGARAVISALPSHAVREIFARIGPHIPARTPVLSATKGIEDGTCLLVSEVIVEVLGESFRGRVAALSGPSFALEVARGDPSAAVVASPDETLARAFQTDFAGRNLRLYTNPDLVGTQIGGAVKNVIAIAAGIVAGLGFGSNTAAALITRGLSEVTRLSVAAGGSPATLSGLAGLGDLVLTCTGALSRNRAVGIELGKGRRIEEILAGTRYVAEGVITTRSTRALARKLGVEMPITEQMNAVLYTAKPPLDAIRELMERELKAES